MALLVWCGGARCADVRAGCVHFATTRLAIVIGKRRTRYRHRACLCCRWSKDRFGVCHETRQRVQ